MCDTQQSVTLVTRHGLADRQAEHLLLPSACLPAGRAVQADPTAPLSFLCFANVPPPPPTPWCEAHSLLLAALEAAADSLEDQQQGLALAAALDSLDIDW